MYSELFAGKIDQSNLVGITKSVTPSNTFQIYPNPSGNIFTITDFSGKNSLSSLIVTDLQGRVIISEQNQKRESVQHIDLSAFPKGVYILQVNDGGEKTVRKLVKN